MRQIRLKIEFSSDFDKKNKLQKKTTSQLFFLSTDYIFIFIFSKNGEFSKKLLFLDENFSIFFLADGFDEKFF